MNRSTTWQFVVILCLLALIALIAVACARPETGSLAWIKQQERIAATRAYQQCLINHRHSTWPNEIYYAHGEHPCDHR